MKITLNGYDLDNLIKKLYLKHIPIYNLSRLSNKEISFEINDRDYKKVKRYVANFKMVRTLSNIKRLPKLIATNVGVLIGVFIGIIFSLFISNYTWQIQVYGTEMLSTNDIIDVLAENNVRIGKINLISSEEIEEILLKNYDRIAQVSVIKQGTAIVINLSEKLVYNETEYAPIYAKFNGIIRNINIVTGTTNVKVGDYVNVGDILVLPFNLTASGEKVSVEPIAEIKADIFMVNVSELPRVETVLQRTGNSKIVYDYKLFNFHIFSGRGENSFALFETVSYNENIGILLPFSRDVTIYYELSPVEITHDFSLEKDELVEKSLILARSALPAYEDMLYERTDVRIYDDTMYAYSTIAVYGVING